jgi:hypothetical protein
VKYLVLLLAIGCGGSDKPPRDPHGAGTCDSSWTANGYTDCEAGCADAGAALGAKGPSCQGTLGSGAAFTCTKTFEFDGQTGCCASDKPQVLWADCP